MVDRTYLPDDELVRCLEGAGQTPEQIERLGMYAHLLVTDGVDWGLLGPREVTRVWDRHILNCLAVVAASDSPVEPGSAIVDVGSGAGLPGLVWSLARPDCSITVVDPLARRTRFLEKVVAELDLGQSVTVVTARATGRGLERDNEPIDHSDVDVVTARALKALPILVEFAAPLLRSGGRLLAIKGVRASAELHDAGEALDRWGFDDGQVLSLHIDGQSVPSRVIQLTYDSRKNQ